MSTKYSLDTIRALVLHTHRLATPNGQEPVPSRDTLIELIEDIACVQIDALQMVRRSHEMIIWSRLGNYDPTLLAHTVYGDPDTPENDRLGFEYWFHAACILPLSYYAVMQPQMKRRAEEPHQRTVTWLSKPDNQKVLAEVRRRIKAEGALRAADFKDNSPGRGPWWDWKPAKQALELLFSRGELIVADRRRFQRIYDLPERVLPDWVDRTPMSLEESWRRLLSTAVRVFGACEARQAADFTHMSRLVAAPLVAALVAEGELVEIQVELMAGQNDTWLVHTENLPLLAQAAAGKLTAERTTFLSPFDNLWYGKGRVMQLWGFEQKLEAYAPKGQYRWGYFCLPILHRDQLIGRFDPKLERKTGVLRLKSMHLEPGVVPDERMVVEIAAAMADFMTFHQAQELVVEKDESGFGKQVVAALPEIWDADERG